GEEPKRQAQRPVKIPRGSSTYIPPSVPSPYSANSPPAPALTQPTVQPYNPPPITTFSDRVNSAIQAYPLERGIGNNPLDQQQFIRQRLKQGAPRGRDAWPVKKKRPRSNDRHRRSQAPMTFTPKTVYV